MKPYFDNGQVQIFNADSREILPALSPATFGLPAPESAELTEAIALLRGLPRRGLVEEALPALRQMAVYWPEQLALESAHPAPAGSGE